MMMPATNLIMKWKKFTVLRNLPYYGGVKYSDVRGQRDKRIEDRITMIASHLSRRAKGSHGRRVLLFAYRGRPAGT